MGAWLVELLEGLVAGDKAESEQLHKQVEELRRKWADANALVKQVENRPRYEQERAALAEEVVRHEGRTEGLQAALQQECAHDVERLGGNRARGGNRGDVREISGTAAG